jgi:hypothetical protein
MGGTSTHNTGVMHIVPPCRNQAPFILDDEASSETSALYDDIKHSVQLPATPNLMIQYAISEKRQCHCCSANYMMSAALKIEVEDEVDEALSR